MFRGRIVFSMRSCWHFTIDHGQGGHLLSFLHSKITSMHLKKNTLLCCHEGFCFLYFHLVVQSKITELPLELGKDRTNAGAFLVFLFL